MMRKSIIRLLMGLLAILVLAAGCKKKNTDSNSSENNTTQQEETKAPALTADDIIKNAETMTYTSTDSDDTTLYDDYAIPFDEVLIMPQMYTAEDIVNYDTDKLFFTPAGKDYLICSFEEGKTLLYTYDYAGNPIEMRGRVVYASKDALLSANKDKNLVEFTMNENGYTYCDNILYYQMDETGLASITHTANKYNFMKIAANGLWKDYFYYFSVPYKPSNDYLYADTSEEKQSGDQKEEDGEVYSEDAFGEKKIYELFTNIMNAKNTDRSTFAKYFTSDVSENLVNQFYSMQYRSPSEFANHKVLIAAQEGNLCFASVVFYTVPKDYPKTKVDSYIFGALLEYDETSKSLKVKATSVAGSPLEDTYYRNTLTDYCYEAYSLGLFYRKYLPPFNLEQYFGYENIVYGAVAEVFNDELGNFYVTLYFANETDEKVTIGNMDYLAMECEQGILFEVSAGLNFELDAHSATVYFLSIPQEFFNYSEVSYVSVSAFEYTVN